MLTASEPGMLRSPQMMSLSPVLEPSDANKSENSSKKALLDSPGGL